MVFTGKFGFSSRKCSAQAAIFAATMMTWFLLPTDSALAGPLDPPTGARTWISFRGGGQSAVHATSVDAEFIDPNSGLLAYFGLGGVTANSIRASNESRFSSSFMTLGLHDTYTVHGPADLMGDTVTIEAVMRVEGKHASVTNVHGNVRHVSSSIRGRIGTWSGRLDNYLVNEFPGSFNYSTDSFHSGAYERTFDFTVTHEREVVVGETFDLAYSIDLSAGGARLDASNTATIDFVLPEGITLTSDLGWTSPHVVPEPSTLMLAVTGGALLALVGRRRLSTRKHAS